MFIFHFDLIGLLTLLSGVILPLLVGLVTTREQSASIKSVLLLVLSIVATVVGQIIQALQAHAPFDVFAALLFAVGTFLIGVGSHFGFWKPVGASRALQVGGIVRTKPAQKAGR